MVVKRALIVYGMIWPIEICKISPLDIPNQTLIRNKNLSGHIYDTFKHFCQTNEYNEIGLLLLALLGKVVKEKNELRNQIPSSSTE